MDESKVTSFKKEVAEEQMPTISEETKAFINDAARRIIEQGLTAEEYDHTLCSIGVNYNQETKKFDMANISLFNIPQSTTDIIGVTQFVIDLEKEDIAGIVKFVSPIVPKRDDKGKEVEIVLIGKGPDVSITNANIVADMMRVNETHEDAAPTDDSEVVEEEDEK